jgi:hypothetical protein
LKGKFEGENIKILKESQREAKPLLKQIFPFPFLRGRGYRGWG